MDDDYKSLREEMKQWQDRRFVILSASAGLVGAILGLKVVGETPDTANWPWSSAVLLLLLASACSLSRYAGEGNARAAAYLEVFYESEPNSTARWETRLRRLRTSQPALLKESLNRILAVIYSVLSVLSVLAPWGSHQSYPLQWTDYLALGISGVWFLYELTKLLRAPDWDRYKTAWEKIQKDEMGTEQKTTSDGHQTADSRGRALGDESRQPTGVDQEG